MEVKTIIDDLAVKSDSKIVMLVADGLGGLPLSLDGKTELETAKTPNMDKIAPTSSMGLMEAVYPGVTPGSGPGHLGLFGYDPIACNMGRGVLAALGINFDLKDGDLCARINFCTVDSEGKITDRRAGRIGTDINERLCEKLRTGLKAPNGVDLFVETVKEHRAAIILRGKKFYADIADTDPQVLGVLPLDPEPIDKKTGEDTIEIIKNIIEQAKQILSDEDKANMILLRGFAEYTKYPTMEDRFKLRSLALASYPMYRGLAKLIGMDVNWEISTMEEQITELKNQYDNYDFFFVHFKYTDSSGEDGDFDRKVKMVEKVDSFIPQILELNPEVFVLTCDHSTPAKMSAHSWHRIPTMIHSKLCRPDKIEVFDEISCLRGSLNGYNSKDIMPLALAHAMKLKKFGA